MSKYPMSTIMPSLQHLKSEEDHHVEEFASFHLSIDYMNDLMIEFLLSHQLYSFIKDTVAVLQQNLEHTPHTKEKSSRFYACLLDEWLSTSFPAWTKTNVHDPNGEWFRSVLKTNLMTLSDGGPIYESSKIPCDESDENGSKHIDSEICSSDADYQGHDTQRGTEKYVSTLLEKGDPFQVIRNQDRILSDPQPQTSDTSGVPESNEPPCTSETELDSKTAALILRSFERSGSMDTGMDHKTFENEICCQLLNVGKYLSERLFSRIVTPGQDKISFIQIKQFWMNRLILGSEDPFVNEAIILPDEKLMNVYQNRSIVNFFTIVKEENCDVIQRYDLFSCVREMVNRHPAFEFLRNHEEFTVRYMDSVVDRVFYQLDIHNLGHLRFKEIKRSNLAHVWCSITEDVEANLIRKFFSYEHFYIIYCEFYNLDDDFDMLLSKDDVVRYNEHSLSFIAVERIFRECDMPFKDCNQDKMCFDDFVWLIISCEDATSDRALEFWFKILDLDGDGCIRDHEIKVFFEYQMSRLLALTDGLDVKFEDFLCQMNDAINPKHEGQYYLSDLKRSRKHGGAFLQALVSLPKFVNWEQKDAHNERNLQDMYPDHTPWEIFCKEKWAELLTQEGYSEEEVCEDDVTMFENNKCY